MKNILIVLILGITGVAKAESVSKTVSRIADGFSNADFVKCDVGTSHDGTFYIKGSFYLNPKSAPLGNHVIAVDEKAQLYAKYSVNAGTVQTTYFQKVDGGKMVRIGATSIDNVFKLTKADDDPFGGLVPKSRLALPNNISSYTKCYSIDVNEILENANKCSSSLDFGDNHVSSDVQLKSQDAKKSKAIR